MAAPLLQSSAVFRHAIRACADALRPHNIDLLAEFGKEEGWKHPALAMVGLVAVQVRLIRHPRCGGCMACSLPNFNLLRHSAAAAACCPPCPDSSPSMKAKP
jgi:hypothetical protein